MWQKIWSVLLRQKTSCAPRLIKGKAFLDNFNNFGYLDFLLYNPLKV